MLSKRVAPKDVQVLIPGIYEYVTSHGKGELRVQVERDVI